jgi:PAT family beta-lactamase induction signal transducer AmpG
MAIAKPEKRNPWAWVPTLYFAEGVPYILVMSVSVAFYKSVNISNTDIALFTSLLYFPWVLKPFWSPAVDMFKTKRLWIISMQLIVGLGLLGVTIFIPSSNFFLYTLLFLCLIAISSATHDIAADGFYMIGLNQKQQAFYVGIRSTFYRVAMWTGQGLLVIIAGYFQVKTGNISTAWQYTFTIITVLYLSIFIYHNFILPYPKTDKPAVSEKGFFSEFIKIYKLFFKKKNIGIAITFLLIYRFGEAQLVKLAQPFLLDPRNAGGLGLSLEQIGIAYGTMGVVALLVGGILGGVIVSRDGLKKWIWWMFAAINLPHILYIYLAFVQPDNFYLISLCVAGEQFGYGFGFTAYMLYMIYISDGEFKTSHFALCTGIMALSMMIPGAFSGMIQEFLGYKFFFIWIFLTMIPGYFIIRALPFDPEFGKKTEEQKI